MKINSEHNYKISTIIPVYNQEKHIEKALNSVINQTFKPYEIIIINDASTDKTQEKCKEFKMSYNNIKIIDLKENQGVSNARNIGIDNATGDYIHFMDSDDVIEKDLIITGTKYNENDKINIYIPKKRRNRKF